MHGLYLLWWVHEKGMPAPIVAAILAAGDLAVAAFEVPTGWFADRFGHRLSLIAGSFVQILGMLLCWLGEGIPGLIAASVLVALGDAFRSGADQALLYRSCRAIGCESGFQAIEARARAVQTVALVVLVLAGGVIVETWSFAAGWAVETALCVAGLAMACAMVEPPACTIAAEETCASSEIAVPPARGSSRRGAGLVSARMALLVLPGAFLGAASGAASFLAQTADRIDPAGVTMLVAVITLAEAAGSALAARLPGVKAAGLSALAAAGVALIGLAVVLPAAFLVGVVGLSFLAGLAGPMRAAAIQRLVADDVRARAASLASACDMVLSTIALPLAGLSRSARARRR